MRRNISLQIRADGITRHGITRQRIVRRNIPFIFQAIHYSSITSPYGGDYPVRSNPPGGRATGPKGTSSAFSNGVTRNRGLSPATGKNIAFHFTPGRCPIGCNAKKIKDYFTDIGVVALNKLGNESGNMTTSKRDDVDNHVAVYDDRLPEPELADRGGHPGDKCLIFQIIRVVGRVPVDIREGCFYTSSKRHDIEK